MGMVVALERLIRQEDHEFDTSLGYLQSPSFKSKQLKVWLSCRHLLILLGSMASKAEKGAAYTVTQHSSCKGGKERVQEQLGLYSETCLKEKEKKLKSVGFLHVVLYWRQGHKFLLPQDPKNRVALKDS